MRFYIISGVVSNLVVSKGFENILFSSNQSQLLGIGSIAAAGAGEGLSSSMMAGANQGATTPMEFFSCTIEGERISGRFYKIDFKNGEEIDFVVDRLNGTKEVQAARNRRQRVVWTLPYRSKGHRAQRKSNILVSLAMSFGASILFFLMVAYSEGLSDPASVEMAMRVAASGFALGLIICYRVCRKVYRGSVDATHAFEALGFADPANVSLPRDSWRAEKRYAAESDQAPVRFSHCRFRYNRSALLNSLSDAAIT